MIFEFWFDSHDAAAFEEYLAESARLRRLLPGLAGFESIERFESVSEPGKFVAIGYFCDEEAITAWRTSTEHRRAQALGRRRFFTDYRLRMAEVIRDYGRMDRAEAPADSKRHHDDGIRDVRLDD